MTDLLFELFTTLTGERDLLSAIQAFFFLTSKPMTEGAIATQYGGSYDAIRARAPQLAPIMDEFLAAHGGLAWNAQTYKYNFSSAQARRCSRSRTSTPPGAIAFCRASTSSRP
jgi:hypothetical protein